MTTTERLTSFRIADFEELFGPARVDTLAGEQRRLLESYLRFGRGFETVLHLWAPEHEDGIKRAALAFGRRHPGLRPNELMLESQAWQEWRASSPEAAERFILDQMPLVWDEWLDLTQRTTFLAVTHGLGKLGLLGEVERITHIKGEEEGSSGTHQFRLFVNLKVTALDRIRTVLDGPNLFSIHPGFPTSFREKKEKPPRLQICTRDLLERDSFGRVDRRWEATDRGADIDIDYRDLNEGHLRPSNSDVTSDEAGFRNWVRHADHYGALPGLAIA